MRPLLTALALSWACVSAQAIGWPEHYQTNGQQTPAEFKSWADDRVEKIHDDVYGLGMRLRSEDERTRRKLQDEVVALKVRLAKAEGRLQEIGTRDDQAAWKTREDLRGELEAIDGRAEKLEKKLERK